MERGEELEGGMEEAHGRKIKLRLENEIIKS
jgi:hypothetical protein